MSKRATAVIFLRTVKNERQFLLQHRAKYLHHGGNKLGLVQGSIDPGETSIEAAYRESGEEASLDKYIDFNTFKKHVKRITKNHYNCYVFDTTNVSQLKKWNPIPNKRFAHEMSLDIWATGHFWIDVKLFKSVLRHNANILGIGVWDRTRDFLMKNWKTIIKN